MADPETITLPKSGVVLTKVQDMWWASDRGPFHLRLRMATHDDIPWCCEVYGLTGRVFRWARTLEDCVSDLDAEVMKLRAALLPPSAIVVADTPETVERVARAIHAENVAACDGVTEWEDACESVRQFTMCQARAVLAALREVAA